MSDYLTRAFRAQLTTTMDAVLRKAVFDIMNIFENTLYDHQMEMAQKGEEVAQLKIKLQTAELRLKDLEIGGDKGAETVKTQTNSTARETDVTDAPAQTSNVPEIDFEVPDYWCAPLGNETGIKRCDGIYPSVRLRRLTIPVSHIPIRKHEVGDYDVNLRQKTNNGRKSKRLSTLNKNIHSKDRKLQRHAQGARRAPIRNDMKMLLQDIQKGYSALTNFQGLQRGERNLRGIEQEKTSNSKREQKQSAVTESKSTEEKTVKNYRKNTYSCKICKKIFDTEFGRNIHANSHRRCRGCKRRFPLLSALKCHKSTCKKLKKLLEEEATTAPETPSGKAAEPGRKQLIIEKTRTSSSSTHSESPTQEDEPINKYSCTHCNKKFNFPYRLQQHIRIHTGEKPFTCSMCPKEFRLKQALKSHVERCHADETNSTDTNGDLALMELYVKNENNTEDLISSSHGESQEFNNGNVQRQHGDKKLRWKTMGERHRNGFICLVCRKSMKTKPILMEHYRIHTGEKPFRCDRCPAMFRTHSQLYVHKKKCRLP